MSSLVLLLFCLYAAIGTFLAVIFAMLMRRSSERVTESLAARESPLSAKSEISQKTSAASLRQNARRAPHRRPPELRPR